MKKLFIIIPLVLCACTNSVKSESGAAALTEIKTAPAGCNFLYAMDADANFYSESDAVRYVENQIVKKGGNSFVITKKEKHQNEWKMFAPEYSYTITADVYDCPAAK